MNKKLSVQTNNKILREQYFYYEPSNTAHEIYFYPYAAGTSIYEKDFFIKRNHSETFYIMYTIKGKGILLYNKKKYTLSERDVFFIDGRNESEFHSDQCEWHTVWLCLDGVLANKSMEIFHENLGVVVEMQIQNQIEQLIHSLIELFSKKDEFFEAKASIIIQQVLLELLINSEKKETLSHVKVINLAIQHIKNNYSRGISIQELSEITNYNPHYFYRIFKAQTGFTLHEYLVKYRINQSIKLLIESDMMITEIAEKVGFEDYNSYLKAFTRYNNFTPLQYRTLNAGRIAGIGLD